MANKGNKFMWGVAVGVLLGILFAPREGEETRKKLAEDLKHFKEGFDEASEAGLKKYNELKKETTPVAQDLKNKAKPYVTALKDGLEGKENSFEDEG